MKSKPNKSKSEIVETIEIEEADFTFHFVSAIKLNLELAGILFENANIQFKEGQKKFEKLEKEIKKYQESYHKLAEKYAISSSEFITYQSQKLRNIEVFYEPVVRHFSTAKILLVCCAENYINEVAGVILKGRSLEEFDKLSIVGKWIFIQELLKLKKKLTIDKQPLQGFAQLVNERNKLVHFKGMKKSLQTLQIPDYINDLNLTPKACLSNLNAVKELIKDFSSNWKGTNGPRWLVDRDSEYRNPCFYLGDRENQLLLYSDKYDYPE